MSRADIREQRPSRPSHRAIAQAVRVAWEPSAREVEIVRLRDEERLTVRAIATRVGVSRARVDYLYRRYKSRMDERVQREHEEADGERASTVAREVVPSGTDWDGASSH